VVWKAIRTKIGFLFVGASIEEKPKPLPARPPLVNAAEEFPGLGPASGPLELAKSINKGKKNKKKANANNEHQATKKKAAEPTSLSSIADLLGNVFYEQCFVFRSALDRSEPTYSKKSLNEVEHNVIRYITTRYRYR
jgi:hypothetical protein